MTNDRRFQHRSYAAQFRQIVWSCCRNI